MRHGAVVGAAVLIVAAPSFARELPVPPGKGWGHAATGIALMPHIAGLSRTGLTDLGTQELDIAAQYEEPTQQTALTIYLFRPALESVPVWFDRSATAIELRRDFGAPTAAMAPTAFARPGSIVTDSLRAVWVPTKGPYRATALAVMPVGDWIVAVRISSKALDAAPLDAKLDAVLAGIRFPKDTAPGPVAVPVAPCPTSLDFKHADLVKPEMTDILLTSVMTAARFTGDDERKKQDGTDAAAEAPLPPLCRDGTPTLQYGVYHRPDQTDGYLLAVGDAGRTVSVSAGLAALTGSTSYSVTFNDLDASMVFPGFDRLPQPKQVLDDIAHHKPVARSSIYERNITISSEP